MSIIKIKRSSGTGSPASLGQGELAYSYLSGTQANGGDRLYIGTGTETNGNAANIEVIGGKYFTEKLDHTPGTLTANSALIVDSNSKIDVLNIDNITINGNAITSTDTNGNIQLSPNGSGSVDVATSKIINVVDPTANQDAATKKYVDDQLIGVVSNFTIAGDTGSDTFETGQTLTFAGGSGITTTVSNNQVQIDPADFTITLGGDLTGSVTITDLGSATLTATIAADSVALGTDTTGSYVESLVEGTGVTITNNSGEGATPTIAIGQDVSTSANVIFNTGDFQSDVIIEGNLTVNGNTVTTNVTQLDIEDNIIHIASNNSADTVDFGWVGHYINGGSNHAGVFRDSTDGEFYIFSEYTKDEITGTTIDRLDPSFALANVNANTFIGALQGNANTATALETARTISLDGDLSGSASFDGTANVTITATIAADSVALGTDTTGDYVESVGVTAGTGLSVTGTGEGATVTLAGVDATTSVKGVASFSSTNFTVTSGAVTISAIDGGTY